MADKAPISEMRASATDTSVTLAWAFHGRARPVRVLRSVEWFPASPDDHLTGAFCAELAYAGDGRTFTDWELAPDKPYFYSLFVAGRRRTWSAPVQTKVWTIDDRDTSEVSGERPRPQPVRARPLAAALAPPAFVVAYLATMLAPTVLWFRIAAAAALAVVAAWRWLEEPDYEFGSFLRWLAVPVVASTLVVAGIAFFNVFYFAFTSATTTPLDLGWLVLVAAPLAMIGAWLAATHARLGRLHDDALKRLAILAGPPLAALALPVPTLLVLGAVGAWLWIEVRNETRSTRAEMLHREGARLWLAGFGTESRPDVHLHAELARGGVPACLPDPDSKADGGHAPPPGSSAGPSLKHP